MTSTFDKIFMPVFLVVIITTSLVWAGKTVYYIYNPPQNKEVTFNVVGIVNATNSSIVSIHFECIKFCVNQIGHGLEAQYKCYEQCEKLGRIKCAN